MVCFDTSFLLALVRRDPGAEKRLEDYTSNGTAMSTTPITICELFKGAYRSKKDENVSVIRKIISYLGILDFSLKACETYGRLVNELQLKGSPIGDLDTMIASIALVHGESLLTKDKKHFERVPSLMVETW